MYESDAAIETPLLIVLIENQQSTAASTTPV
ncbi:Uncharacterised protein [Vibrio cholerae]|nr:Uncharacterised protein [Vibrio cholerae]CSI63256.1 Uncharacterised protein [Vibrio cholerae]